MQEEVTIPNNLIPAGDIRKRAWLIIIVAFWLLCSSSLVLSGGIYFFLFLSSIPLDASIQVSQGTAGLVASDFSEQVIRTQLSNVRDRPTTISTDDQSQATLTFRIIDDEEPSPVLIIITLENSSSVTIRRADRPRFRWGRSIYRVELSDVSGEIEIYSSHAASRPFTLLLENTAGIIVRIDQAGRYGYESSDAQLRLVTREGVASFLTQDRTASRLVSRGEEAIIVYGRSPYVATSAENLLENSLFDHDVAPDQDGQFAPPMRWGCSDIPDTPPGGSYKPDMWEGRAALRLIRAENASSHGETGCLQIFPGGGQDVSTYTYLEIETTFLISYQSLSDCGIKGSECPLMLLMDYVDVSGNARQWYQGFYTRHDPQTQYPTTCVTCGRVYQPHRRLNDKVWYTYNSSNLLDLFTPIERPAYITALKFYASGHQYDVFVSDVQLLAGQTEVIPPNENIIPIATTPTPSGD